MGISYIYDVFGGPKGRGGRETGRVLSVLAKPLTAPACTHTVRAHICMLRTTNALHTHATAHLLRHST